VKAKGFDVIEREIERTQVLILAGGKAKRMGKIDVPKALLEVCGRPLVDYAIDLCINNGFREFVFLLGYKHEQIEEHLKDLASKYEDASFEFSVEPPEVEGKGKALRYAIEMGKIDLKKRCLVLYPDDLFFDQHLPLKLLLQHLQGVGMFETLGTLVLVSGTEYPYGVGELDEFGVIRHYEEKPFIARYTNTGMSMFEPAVMKMVKKEISLDTPGSIEFERVVLPELAKEGKLYSLVVPPQVWIPVNTQKEYEYAEKRMREFMEKNTPC